MLLMCKHVFPPILATHNLNQFRALPKNLLHHRFLNNIISMLTEPNTFLTSTNNIPYIKIANFC